ncbi:MAG: hypothetical protein CBC13_01375 [Planctomycetia bacterium TMED53]|nr:MAG: hypothetical protein CBC13_01375 [Planctomycetia bacterium TMED53]
MSDFKTIAITSGKGGVGKTHLSVAASIEWARCGQRVILVDIDLNTPNAHIYLSVKDPRWTLKDVLKGSCSLEDALIEIPESNWGGTQGNPGGSLHLLPGSVDRADLLEMSLADHKHLQSMLDDQKHRADLIVFDTGAGVDHHLLLCCDYCEEVLVVTNSEASSRSDAVTVLFCLAVLDSKPSRWLVPNLVEDQVQGRRLFDHFQQKTNDKELKWAGAIREDGSLRDAAMIGKLVSIEEPGSNAAMDIRNIARKVLEVAAGETDGEFIRRIDDIISG